MVGKEREEDKKNHKRIWNHNNSNASEVRDNGNGGSKDNASKMRWRGEEISSEEVAKNSEG